MALERFSGHKQKIENGERQDSIDIEIAREKQHLVEALSDFQEILAQVDEEKLDIESRKAFQEARERFGAWREAGRESMINLSGMSTWGVSLADVMIAAVHSWEMGVPTASVVPPYVREQAGKLHAYGSEKFAPLRQRAAALKTYCSDTLKQLRQREEQPSEAAI